MRRIRLGRRAAVARELRPEQIALKSPDLAAGVVAGDPAATRCIEVFRRRRGAFTDHNEAVAQFQRANRHRGTGENVIFLADDLRVDMFYFNRLGRVDGHKSRSPIGLEETHLPKEEYCRGHRVIGHNDGEIEREKQKLLDSGVVKPGDFFIARLIV